MKKNDKVDLTVNQAWEELFEKHNIVAKVKNDGLFPITAKEIKEFKEPRLMAKWDSSESLPKIFKENKINILPNSRGSYVLGNFQLYEKIPSLIESARNMTSIELEEYETIDVANISSESNAINILNLSGAMNNFLGEVRVVQTFNGRMGTGLFDFSVDTKSKKEKIIVQNAQCEIDGGFESSNNVIIMEAKNVVYPDFHIRQLYYPYRLWKTRVKKPIRLVFAVYSNQIYRLLEYKFETIDDYNSIKLLQEKNYSLQDTTIELNDLICIFKSVKIKTNDDQNHPSNDVPFIQADSFERVISLLENLYDNPMTAENIADLMQFENRQSDYYFNAGKYLGLFQKEKLDDMTCITLTNLGVKIYKTNYKERQLTLVGLILKHQIFNDMFKIAMEKGEMPNKQWVMWKMRAYNVCNEPQIERRSSSVLGWMRWVLTLPQYNK